MIVPLHEKYFKRMADIHCNSMKGDFQVLLGMGFLKKVYKRFEVSEYGVGYIFLNENIPSGFVLATYNINRFMRELFIKDGLKLLIIMVGQVLRKPFIIPSLIAQFLLNQNLKKIEMDAELVTITVDYKYRNKGIGESLIMAVIDNFRRKGIISFKLTTKGTNDLTNNFYQKLGFNLICSFERFSIKQNIYTYSLKHTP